MFPRRHNRGRIEAVEEYAKRSGRTMFPRRHNRGRIEAWSITSSHTAAIEFPRRHNRGRIEAPKAASTGVLASKFPRRHNRGRIEAVPTLMPHLPAAPRFHGVTTVAELKLLPRAPPIGGAGVSTASQPWPN